MNRVRATGALLATATLLAGGLAAGTTAGSAAPAESSARAATTTSVNFGDRSYRAGSKKLVVRGKVSGPKRTVALQYRARDGWHTFAKDRSNGRHRYEVRTAFNWYGKHPVRVHVPAAGGQRAWTSKPRTVKVGDGYSPRGKARMHNFTTTRGLRWRFNPCQTIRYRINPAHIGKRVKRDTKRAMALMSRATGLDIRYAGRTSYVPFAHKSFPGAKADLVLAWASEKQRPGLKGYGGLGGPIWGYQSRTAGGNKIYRIDQAGALFNLRYKDRWAKGFRSSGNTPMGHILLHEIGHAIGLNHVKAGSQMMVTRDWTRTKSGVWRSQYGAGDRAGLRLSGAGMGCLKPLRGRGVLGAAPEPLH